MRTKEDFVYIFKMTHCIYVSSAIKLTNNMHASSLILMQDMSTRRHISNFQRGIGIKTNALRNFEGITKSVIQVLTKVSFSTLKYYEEIFRFAYTRIKSKNAMIWHCMQKPL